jgi:hypothetical protein
MACFVSTYLNSLLENNKLKEAKLGRKEGKRYRQKFGNESFFQVSAWKLEREKGG